MKFSINTSFFIFTILLVHQAQATWFWNIIKGIIIDLLTQHKNDTLFVVNNGQTIAYYVPTVLPSVPTPVPAVTAQDANNGGEGDESVEDDECGDDGTGNDDDSGNEDEGNGNSEAPSPSIPQVDQPTPVYDYYSGGKPNTTPAPSNVFVQQVSRVTATYKSRQTSAAVVQVQDQGSSTSEY